MAITDEEALRLASVATFDEHGQPIVELHSQSRIWVTESSIDPHDPTHKLYFSWGPSLCHIPEPMVDLLEVALTDVVVFLMHWSKQGFSVQDWQKGLISGEIGAEDLNKRRQEVVAHRKKGI